MQKTTTRVRTREGKVYEERLENDNFTTEYKGLESQPTYMSNSEKGFTVLIPAVFDQEKQRWVNKIYEEDDQASATSSTPTATTSTLSFVTFNVWFSELYWKERAEALVSILEDKNPDYICLQEVTQPFLDVLKDNKFIQRSYYLSDKSGNTVYPYGTIILSRFPISSLQIHVLPTNQGRRFLLAETVCKLNNITYKIHVSTIHLESLGERDMRIVQLDKIFSILNTFDHAFFLGDYNFPDGTPENNHISQKFSDIWKEVIVDVGKIAETVPGYGRFDRIVYYSKGKAFTSKCITKIGEDPIPSIPDCVMHPSDHKGT